MNAENNVIKLLVEANSYREKMEFVKAIEIYNRLLSIMDDNIEISKLIASCYFHFGLINTKDAGKNFKLAIETIKKAIEISPNNSSLHSDLGLYYKHGCLDYEKAKSEYLIALKTDPKNMNALEGLSSLYRLPEKIITLEESIEFLESAVLIDSEDPHLYHRLGGLYKEKKELNKMNKAWEKSLMCDKPLNRDLAKNILREISEE